MFTARCFLALVAVVSARHAQLASETLTLVPQELEPRFMSVRSSCSVKLNGRPSITREGTCMETSACTKESVPGHCKGAASIQCCVDPVPCTGSDGTAGQCKDKKHCTDGRSESSTKGATGCQSFSGSVLCCVGAGGSSSGGVRGGTQEDIYENPNVGKPPPPNGGGTDQTPEIKPKTFTGTLKHYAKHTWKTFKDFLGGGNSGKQEEEEDDDNHYSGGTAREGPPRDPSSDAYAYDSEGAHQGVDSGGSSYSGGDDYATALATPTCPRERRMTRVCKENHGSSSCGDKRSMDTCSSGCKTWIKKHKEVSWVCEPVKGSGQQAWLQTSTSHPTHNPPEITRREIIRRASTWINERIRYSQKRFHGVPTVSDNKMYRTDCTGFVSMAWGTAQFGTARYIKGNRKKDGTLYGQVACEEMLPGDALVSDGHIILFRRWIDKEAKTWEAWEESGTASGTVATPQTFESFPKPEEAIVKRRGEYSCIRRKKISG